MYNNRYVSSMHVLITKLIYKISIHKDVQHEKSIRKKITLFIYVYFYVTGFSKNLMFNRFFSIILFEKNSVSLLI